MRTIKQLLITVAMLLCSVVASAHDFEVDGIYYNIISTSDLTVQVTSGDSKYSGAVIIPSTVAYKANVFTVKEIRTSAFSGCSALTSITIPNSITSVGVSAFKDCTSLKTLRFEDGAETLNLAYQQSDNIYLYESGLFDDCPLDTLYLGRNISYNATVYYGYSPFYYTTTLKSITISDSVTSIRKYAFYGCSGLTSIVIPNSVKSIGDYAFNGCTSLKNVRFEDGENSISLGYNAYISNDTGKGLFYDCPLETLYLGRDLSYDTTSSHGYSPFYNKSTLTSVTIGNSVTSIGNYAFDGCSGVTNIHLLSKTPPTVGSDNFTQSQYTDITVYVPTGTLETYKTANTWKNFWDIREGSTTETPEEEVKKCATPVITYNDNGLDITTETDGAEIHTDITCSDANSYNGDRIDLSATYSITTYATKSGYLNSDTATATLCWIAVSGSSEEDSIIEVEAMPVLITCNNGTINIRGGKDGAEVVVYTTSGVAVGNATITNGNASISTELAMGEIVVVNIAGKGIKIVMQ